MKIVIIIATCVALISVAIWWKLYRRLPRSLSQMVKASPEWKYIFAGVLAVYCVSTWAGLIDSLPGSWQWLLFLTEIGLALVALIPITNKSYADAHTVAAILSAVCINLLALVLCPWVLGLWLAYIIYTLVSNCSHKKLVAELVCGFILVIIALLSPFG